MSTPPASFFLRPGLVAGVAVASGAALALNHTPEGDELAAALGLSVALVVAAIALSPGIARRAATAVLFFMVGVTSGLAAPRPQGHPLLDAAATAGGPLRFLGRLVEAPQRTLAPPRWRSEALQPRVRYTLDLAQIHHEGRWIPVTARVLVSAEDLSLPVLPGDLVEGSARLIAPHAPENPGEPDPRPRLARRAVAYVGALERGALATVTPGTGFQHGAELFRRDFSAFVGSQLTSPDDAALVSALAIGDRGGVSPDLNQAFNASGLAHVLSISGLHLTVAVLALVWLLRRLFGLVPAINARIAPKRLAAIVGLPATAFYVLVTGAPAPAVRAGLGTGLVLLGHALGREAEALGTLGWTLAMVAAFDPAALFEPSTQLSFLGVLGLVLLTPRLRELIPWRPPESQARWPARLGETLLMALLGSLAATLATAHVTAWYFERASLVAALANLVAWPASTLIVPAGALGAALYAISPVAALPFVKLAGLCAWGLTACAKLFGNWRYAALVVPPPTAAQLIAYVVLLAGLVQLRRWPKRLSAALMGVGALLLLGTNLPNRQQTGQLEVTFLSVGQGDSTFVRFPRGATMLIDAGGEVSMRPDPGARVVAPFLRSKGVSQLDVMVASHPHPDHIGGLPAVLQRFPVGELWHDGLELDDGPQAELLHAARETGSRVVDFTQGLSPACPDAKPLSMEFPEVAALAVGDPRCRPPPPTRTIDGVTVEVLHPLGGPDRPAYPELGANDNSLVLRLTHGSVRILLPGDLEHEGESLLLASPYDLTADLLKAPHHGSRTSSTEAFIRAVKPRHVVFCVGKNNLFGFPRAEVVGRYDAAGCRRFRTDEGSVTFVSDGTSIEARPFRAATSP